jgi:DNA-binding NarL/FixJ family response regulator
MRAIIVSNYTLIREGLNSIISRYKGVEVKLATDSVKEAISSIKESKVDIVFIALHEYNENELQMIKEMKEHGVKSRFIILDFNKNKEFFVKAIKSGVEGYILGKSNEMEILYIIEQINNGKKYYDAYFIDSMINENNDETEGIEELTAREVEILCEIGKGMSNKKISEKFFISEHTVKKHINHIFDKLNIRDRTQAALYANRCGIVNNAC